MAIVLYVGNNAGVFNQVLKSTEQIDAPINFLTCLTQDDAIKTFDSTYPLIDVILIHAKHLNTDLQEIITSKRPDLQVLLVTDNPPSVLPLGWRTIPDPETIHFTSKKIREFYELLKKWQKHYGRKHGRNS